MVIGSTAPSPRPMDISTSWAGPPQTGHRTAESLPEPIEQGCVHPRCRSSGRGVFFVRWTQIARMFRYSAHDDPNRDVGLPGHAGDRIVFGVGGDESADVAAVVAIVAVAGGKFRRRRGASR